MNDLPASSRWRPVSMDAPKPTAMWITARVEALLSHYFRPETSENADLLATADWIKALIDIPQEALEQAFTMWIRNEDRRPTPAAIRKEALSRVERRRPAPPGPDEHPFGPTVVSKEELARRREIAGRLGLKVYDYDQPAVTLKRLPTTPEDQE